MKRQRVKQQRIIFITASFLVCLSALFFIVDNFRDNIVFFYSPSELKTKQILIGKTIRVGGLVKEGSVKQLSDQSLEFTITDLQEDLVINYKGIKPDLFREGQGTVAKGVFNGNKNIFFAKELLTKHDENYMPPEVARSLKK